MVKRTVIPGLMVLAVAACAMPSEKPKPPAWTAGYAVPFEVMADCLARQEPNFIVSPQISQSSGIATIGYNPQSAPQAQAQYVVRRTGPGSSEVNWQRFGNVGGLDWLDVEARSRADNCRAATKQMSSRA